ncbi:hypothetical protein B6I21_06715 [candidate division KSB1 bacterium 4572_119]|nr:MAG: hypothetical protein B6I21_06715 [candidate division KSB1 bacterium 4572_119]
MHVNSFRDLEVYKLARQLSLEIFEMTKSFPKAEMYSLTDQINRLLITNYHINPIHGERLPSFK